MNDMSRIVMGLAVVALTMTGCTHTYTGTGWVTLIDGDKGMENFDRVGDANWRAEGGAIVADKGKGGHLVTKNTYKDFELRAEFWADETTQSGIFFRIIDAKKIGSATGYEANIYDQRPGAEYSTGAIVGVASVPVPPIYKTGAKWNVYEISAKGSELTLVLNGVVTAYAVNGNFKEGFISLQFGNRPKLPGGPIKWRKLEIKPL